MRRAGPGKRGARSWALSGGTISAFLDTYACHSLGLPSLTSLPRCNRKEIKEFKAGTTRPVMVHRIIKNSCTPGASAMVILDV